MAHRRKRGLTPRQGDRLFAWLTGFIAAGGIITVGYLAWHLSGPASLAWELFGPGFFTSTEWNQVTAQFGALPYIFGTLVTSLLALLLAAPVSVAVAVFLVEWCPRRLAPPLAAAVELLAAIPSIVYGLWGLFVLIPLLRESVQPWLQKVLGFLPFFQGPPIGAGLLAASVVLAVMIVPTITSIAREVIATIPNDQREAALALGATRWEMIRIGVLPAARSGLLGAALLGLGRALGEAMAVAMVIGNRPVLSASLFSPGYTLASVIANEFAEAATDAHIAALMELGLILLAVSVLLTLGARLLVWSARGGQGKRGCRPGGLGLWPGRRRQAAKTGTGGQPA